MALDNCCEKLPLRLDNILDDLKYVGIPSLWRVQDFPHQPSLPIGSLVVPFWDYLIGF